MNESILNHLFLPHYLPSSAENDFLIQSKHQNEHILLECMKEYFHSLRSDNTFMTLPVVPLLADCVQRWSVVQNPQKNSVSNFKTAIEQIPVGNYLPFYFHAQNAAILIEIDRNNHQPMISSWQVLLPISTITSSLLPQLSCFPVATYRLNNRSQLSSTTNCELLVDFMTNTVEHLTSNQNDRQRNGLADISQSHYVCQWWIQQFQGIKIENNFNSVSEFKKKHRDQIRCNGNSSVPFRRSGLWMTIKVVLQTILTKQLGECGTVIYKLIITHFLTCIIESTVPISVDVLSHAIKKIVRRLNKLESKLLSSNLSNSIGWIEYIQRDIQSKVDQLLQKCNWQTSLKPNADINQKLFVRKSDLNPSQICYHSCDDFKAYLNGSNSNKRSADAPNIDNSHQPLDMNQPDCIPSYQVLTINMNYSTSVALIRMEIWTELHLKQWINNPSLSMDNQFEILQRFFEEYQDAALKHYYTAKGPTDPIGYSRFILTSLRIISLMHKRLCSDSRFERLKKHKIDIPNVDALFEHLVLPSRETMIRARVLYNYFCEFKNKPYPDLLKNIESVDAFGVQFTNQSVTMINSLQQIRAQAESDKQQKTREVINAKAEHNRLINSVSRHGCSCEYTRYGSRITCRKCQIEKQASEMKLRIFENPLPSKNESALAVIFELQMPVEIRSYRDVLWQFINRPKPNPSINMIEWLNSSPHKGKLKSFYTGPDKPKVKLVSSCKSATENKPMRSVASTSIEGFLLENSLTVGISPNQRINWQDELHILTPVLHHPDYKPLQFAVDTTEFAQNQVIAKLSDCSLRLRPTQFIEYGSFRSGHRLQWQNLLSILEMDTLSFAEESVAILILHSILQNGPLTTDSNTLPNHWCFESHQSLLDDHFIDEIIVRLDHHLSDCELNWQNELVLLVITMVTIRMFTICNVTKASEVANLALKCRRIGEKWINLISDTIQKASPSAFNEVQNLRTKLVNIGICCILTFSANEDRIDSVLSSSEHVLSLMKAATTVHDNIVLNNSQSNMSTFIRNMMRYSERVLVLVQPTVAKFLEETSHVTLNEFAAIYWAVISSRGGMSGQWKKQKKDIYDGCYQCVYECRIISIDGIMGDFLVDRMTIGFLPQNITSDELFTRVFGSHVFEVQAAEMPHTYISKRSYHGHGRVQYEFYYNNHTKRLVITERHTNTKEIFQLICHKCFQSELPDIFVSNHSHWLNKSKQIIQFRPVHFKDSDFLDNIPYTLSKATGFLTTNEITTSNKQTLINQKSLFFKKLFSRYFNRLDEKPYVYMMIDDISRSDSLVHIHLSRLGIAFQFNTTTETITSREYSDMCVDKDQWIGSLTGLTFGLLLSPLSVNNQTQQHYPYRKLIVPFGQIGIARTSTDHHSVTIKRSTCIRDSREYFVFILNDRLKILQSTDSPSGWLYLSLLHAMSSHPFPDEYTGMTGMERAFQLLYSAGCSSDRPFDHLSINILRQIAAISPKVSYYPEKTTSAIRIEWHENGLPYSVQHFGYYLIAKNLIHSSEQLNFMYSFSRSTNEKPALINEMYEETVLRKLYWDYRDFYNPLACLSAQMDSMIISTLHGTPTPSTPEYYPQSTNYRNVRLTDGLYKSGSITLSDYSKQHWLPLYRWLSHTDGLKSIWIGLLKTTDSIKTTATNNRENIERFEVLMNFLHYISGRLNIDPFYLQMLKTVLKMPNAISTSFTFPPFSLYSSIEETSFIRNRIHLSSDYNSGEKSQILAEAENSFQSGCDYGNRNNLTDYNETSAINTLFKSWRDNERLRLFLDKVYNLINSGKIETFHNKVPYHPQQFNIKQFQDHHQIQFNNTGKQIDPNLLQRGKQIFDHPHTDPFRQATIKPFATSCQNQFPIEVFTSIVDQNNPTCTIGNYFRTQLDGSWKQLLSDKQVQKQEPTVDQIIKYSEKLRKEAIDSWNELIENITESHERLFQSGLALRLTPTTLVSLFLQNTIRPQLTSDQRTLLGGILVSWTLEQQLERALYFANHDKQEDFKKEISNTPHSNWTPSEYIPWLILELEMNITIRETQIRVAQHMMQPNLDLRNSSVRSIVMQMNMGEGKTSVILPMLAVSLSSSSSSLVRIVVLKSLFPTNYQSLRYKLGGLLNRRVFPFVCRRDLNFNHTQIQQIHYRLNQALLNCDVIMLSPEDILSYDLLTIDKCRSKDFETGRSMLRMQRWMKRYARDILDESDEILHVKYQLIYTVGGQQQVDGGAERWNTIQTILRLVKKYAAAVFDDFKEDVSYKPPERKSAFPHFRLQSQKPFGPLCESVANAWIETKNYRQMEQGMILPFILEPTASIDDVKRHFPSNDIQVFLIIRGLLSSEVLLVALKKRHRVNYGVNPNQSFNRLMAVPFRAKDVVADRTEFGHPDVALVLTHLSYYYSGLSDSQLTRCFDRLCDQEADPASIYDQWVLYEDTKDLPQSIQQWRGVNLKDYEQRTKYLFPTFRLNMSLINYFLNHFVFPREAKQFPHRLVCSPWDLSSSARSNIITGFSGTNDTQLLLPVQICQQDLPELQKTDAIVVNNLLQPENEQYRSIPINANVDEILRGMMDYEQKINVILDVGALFLDGTNEEIAMKWLNLSDRTKIDYAVYFDGVKVSLVVGDLYPTTHCTLFCMVEPAL